jgi:hypothetical protein
MTRYTLIAGVALIALTNAVALGGVAWNRSGEPDSVLKLTERELTSPYGSVFTRESEGGLLLMLNWRVLSNDPQLSLYEGNYGGPEWFDEAKVRELGFDVSAPRAGGRGRAYDRRLPREAFIVLELNGPTYPRSLDRVRKYAEKEAASMPDKPGHQDRVRSAAEAVKREETQNSRLFAVDAGLDAAALRARYPDRARYAIVTGKVMASRTGRHERLQGYIGEIHNVRVNVPREILPSPGRIARVLPYPVVAPERPAFEATIAFGKRFEPWLQEARTGGAR